MATATRSVRNAMAVFALGVAGALSGCGYDVEMNGAVFDYLGVSPGTQKPKGEPRVAARPGIVLPPDLDKLPQPGSEGTATAAATTPAEAFPVDAEQKKVAAASAADRQHEAFCRDALWRAKARGDELMTVQGPKGPCNPSLIRSLTGKDISSGL